MRLSCPRCATEYDVPDAALVGRSRKLHCTQCGTDWRSTPLAPDLTPMPDPIVPNRDTMAHPTLGSTQLETAQAAPDPPPPQPPLEYIGDPEDDTTFATLVEAGRNNEIQYEPDTPARRASPLFSNPPLAISLLLLLLAGIAAIAYLKHIV